MLEVTMKNTNNSNFHWLNGYISIRPYHVSIDRSSSAFLLLAIFRKDHLYFRQQNVILAQIFQVFFL